MSKFKNFINKIIKKENADKENKPSNYISIKESRAIIKYNIKQMKFYEAKKKRKLSLEEFTTTMKDENNIV